jgi:hypothetical protein
VGILDETRFVERLQFFDGQQLFASDLQGIEAFDREMRWLHNRSLHQPGIGNGYAVSGKKGDREVTIGPGYAVDVLGREIVLTEAQVDPVPPVAGEADGTPVFYDLAVSYPDDSALEEAETREGVCLAPRGVVRLQEAPVFCWVRLATDAQGNRSPKDPALKKDIETGLRIRLARVEVLNCRLNQPASIAERRSARPPTLPYVAAGEADLGPAKPVDARPLQALAGRLDEPNLGLFALTAPVDTSAAGFLTTPSYSVSVVGTRTPVIDLPGGGQASIVILDQAQIQDSRAGGFTVFLLGAYLGSPDDVEKGAGVPVGAITAWIRKEWRISWMGVE